MFGGQQVVTKVRHLGVLNLTDVEETAKMRIQLSRSSTEVTSLQQQLTAATAESTRTRTHLTNKLSTAEIEKQQLQSQCDELVLQQQQLHAQVFYFHINFSLCYYMLKSWGTGIRGLMRGMVTVPQGNQELLVVRDKIGRPPGELGVGKFMECDIFPSVL